MRCLYNSGLAQSGMKFSFPSFTSALKIGELGYYDIGSEECAAAKKEEDLGRKGLYRNSLMPIELFLVCVSGVT